MATATAPEQIEIAARPQRDLKLYAHSSLLYWWPVWAVGFVMALWTWLDDSRMAVVPPQTVVQGNTLVAPGDRPLDEPSIHMARSKLPGVIFVVTLLLVVLFCHVWLRGTWALFMAATLVAGVLLVSWMAWWEPLYRGFRLLRIHINLGGYLVISTTLFLAWVLTIFFFDRRTYLLFTTGQVRFRDRLGVQEKAFDTSTILFEKQPYDWFRRLVGWGAGDLILHTGGPHPEDIEFRNVVRVGKWLQALEARLRTRHVV
jgi:lysylphosphatidylglycerol synthetase-like protein (DUF2156 family)